MADDHARSRDTRVLVSFQCKNTGATGSSFAQPEIAKQITAYMADVRQPSISEVVIVDGEFPAARDLARHPPDIVFSPGLVRVTSSVRPASDFDIDLMVSVPHHGSPERAPDLEVPSVGETILSYVCEPDRLEAMLGCLEQNFRRRATKNGLNAAHRYYWFQVARAVISFGLDAVQRLGLLRSLLDQLRF